MLTNQIVLISGASAGIGRACAQVFAAAGCQLILVARRRNRLEELASHLLAEFGSRCHLLPLDIQNRSQVNAAIAELPSEWSTIDILINNAGLARGLAKIHEAESRDWEEMIDTNLKGLLYLSRAVLPNMVARDQGQVINIGSIAGRQVYGGGAVYCATKFGVRALTQGMRIDLLGTRVRCSTVDPGLVETDFSLVRFRGDQEQAASVYQHFPPLQARDIADVVLFCATRPNHVNLSEVLVMPQDQAAAYASYERGVDRA
jgi:NADP-dependent 3-hydroxy acid dehydrogenase YdfG